MERGSIILRSVFIVIAFVFSTYVMARPSLDAHHVGMWHGYAWQTPNDVPDVNSHYWRTDTMRFNIKGIDIRTCDQNSWPNSTVFADLINEVENGLDYDPPRYTLIKIFFWTSFEDKTYGTSFESLNEYQARVDYCLNGIEPVLDDIIGICLAEETSPHNGQQYYLQNIYWHIKDKYPDLPIYQWYSNPTPTPKWYPDPQLDENFLSADGWVWDPKLNNDVYPDYQRGWGDDVYENLLRKYIITGVPVIPLHSGSAAEYGWLYDINDPCNTWKNIYDSNITMWDVTEHSRNWNKIFNLPTSYYWVWLKTTSCSNTVAFPMVLDPDNYGGCSAGQYTNLQNEINEDIRQHGIDANNLSSTWTGNFVYADNWEITPSKLILIDPNVDVFYVNDFRNQDIIDKTKKISGFRDLVWNGYDISARGIVRNGSTGIPDDVNAAITFHFQTTSGTISFPEIKLTSTINTDTNGCVKIYASTDGTTWPVNLETDNYSGIQTMRLRTGQDSSFRNISNLYIKIELRGDVGSSANPPVRIDDLVIQSQPYQAIWEYMYEADDSPDVTGSVIDSRGYSTGEWILSNPSGVSIADGVLDINDLGIGGNHYLQITDASLWKGRNSTIEFRMKLTNKTVNNCKAIQISDGSSYYYWIVTETSLKGYGGSIISLDMNEFQVVRVAFPVSGSAVLYAKNNSGMIQSLNGYTGSTSDKKIILGDIYSDESGHFEFDYVRWLNTAAYDCNIVVAKPCDFLYEADELPAEINCIKKADGYGYYEWEGSAAIGSVDAVVYKADGVLDINDLGIGGNHYLQITDASLWKGRNSTIEFRMKLTNKTVNNCKAIQISDGSSYYYWIVTETSLKGYGGSIISLDMNEFQVVRVAFPVSGSAVLYAKNNSGMIQSLNGYTGSTSDKKIILGDIYSDESGHFEFDYVRWLNTATYDFDFTLCAPSIVIQNEPLAIEWEYRYEASVMPDSTGCIRNASDLGVGQWAITNPSAISVNNGILDINDIGTGGNHYCKIGNTSLWMGRNSTVEVRMSFNEYTGNNATVLRISDGTNYFDWSISESLISNGSEIIYINFTGMVTLRIAFPAYGKPILFVMGSNRKIEGYQAGTTVDKYLIFGDIYSDATGNFKYDYLRWTTKGAYDSQKVINLP